jgi:curved DNA-binding protein
MEYYTTLGINKDASADEIKRAYRGLASKHHPDKGGDTAMFQKIQEAYATLSDPEKKSQYDNPSPFGHNPNGGWQQAEPQGFEHFFHQFGPQFNDIFGGRQARPQRNRNINLQAEITLEDAYAGKEIIASYRLGNGQERTFEVKIPPGVHDGINLRIAGAGDSTNKMVPAGDAMLTIRVLPHSRFQRNGIDLIEQITISAWDAILGKDLLIKTIDNSSITIKIKEGTQPESMLRLQGYGMPDLQRTTVRGNHMIAIKVQIPDNLTEFQKTTLKSILS